MQINNIQLEDNDINKALQMEMQKYPGQEKEILDYYQKNPEAIRQLSAPLFEDKVIYSLIDNYTNMHSASHSGIYLIQDK